MKPPLSKHEVFIRRAAFKRQQTFEQLMDLLAPAHDAGYSAWHYNSHENPYEGRTGDENALFAAAWELGHDNARRAA